MARPTLRELWADARQWWRGSRRVAPYGTRGRVYAARHPEAAGAAPAAAQGEATLTVRVIRATEPGG